MAERGEAEAGSAFVRRLIVITLAEWDFFGRSTRNLGDVWHIGGEEYDEPYRSRVGTYWRAVDRPDWDGGTDEPWSAAFISWCFREAGGEGLFWGDETHSLYVDRIHRGEGMSKKLVLLPPGEAPLALGDLIWNSRWENDEEEKLAPRTLAAALAETARGNFFNSHVDIVTALGDGWCESIGGNVSFRDPGGSVTQSTWRLDAAGCIADDRKRWIGVVKNGL